MKLFSLLAVPVAIMLAGCATPSKTQAAKNQTVYHKPLTSPGAQFGTLPPEVQLTVLAEAGTEEITEVVRDTSSGRVVYKIHFRDPDLYPPLLVAPDGSVLNPNLTVAVAAVQGTRVKHADVPAKVLKAIPERAPGAEVAYINRESWGGREVYVVTFKDQAHNPKLLIAADGSAVEEAW